MLSAAVLAGVAFLAILAFVRETQREHALRLIVSGRAELLLIGGYASALYARATRVQCASSSGGFASRGDEPTTELSARASGDAPPHC